MLDTEVLVYSVHKAFVFHDDVKTSTVLVLPRETKGSSKYCA